MIGSKYTVEFWISGVIPSKKNRHIITKQKTIRPDTKSTEWEEQHAQDLAIYCKQQKIQTPITSCAIHYYFFAGNNRDFDMHNKAESVYDMMELAGLIGGDSKEVVKYSSQVFCGVEKSFNTLVKIIRLDK